MPSPSSASRGCTAATARAIAAAAVIVATCSPAPATLFPNRCHGERPAATLLFPYFEVDLTGGRTTLIAITNTAIGPQLARVTLWTDWGLPTLAFDLYLLADDVQTINVRDVLLAGRGPATGPGASRFAGCPDSLAGGSWAALDLQKAHTGRSVRGLCYGQWRSDPDTAIGYVTVDTTQRCPAASFTPATAGYFGGATPVASNVNSLVGDFFQVDPEQNYAGGQNAVHLGADPEAYSYTFYGRFVDWHGTDKRWPLNSRWYTRFVTGGGFDGGTSLVVWRDTLSPHAAPYDCAGPPWRPLGARNGGFVAWNEQGADRRVLHSFKFPLATQRVSVGALGLPMAFGRFELTFSREGDDTQAWVGWQASASGRFNVDLTGGTVGNCFLFPPLTGSE